MSNVYVVDVPAQRNQHTRYVVIAESAQQAEATVARAETPPGFNDGFREVGRLGTFEPGNEGAAMTALSPIVAIQRPAF
jgi:hypothetical protein